MESDLGETQYRGLSGGGEFPDSPNVRDDAPYLPEVGESLPGTSEEIEASGMFQRKTSRLRSASRGAS